MCAYPSPNPHKMEENRKLIILRLRETEEIGESDGDSS